jgi:hypothetical protein
MKNHSKVSVSFVAATCVDLLKKSITESYSQPASQQKI